MNRTGKPAVEQQLAAIAPDFLLSLVRRALDAPGAELIDWRGEPLGAPSRGSMTGGLYRLSGTALDASRGALPWSLVLKVLALNPAVPGSGDPGHPLYWRREALVYQSGLLATLPDGLRAPRCYAVTDQSDGSCWLWLEDAKDAYGPAWPPRQYERAAYLLGRFNGAYLAGQPMPDFPWLVAGGEPRGVLDAFAWLRDLVADPSLWHHPLLFSNFGDPLAARLLRLWDERGALLDILEKSPYTLCHYDAWRGNMFALVDPGSPDPRLILIDWAYLGRGPLGADAGDLLAPAFGFFPAETGSFAERDALIFNGYLAGLLAVGWGGDAAQLRRSYAAYAAAKYGCLQLWLPAVLDETQRGPWEAISGRPFPDFVRRQALALQGLLALADEAQIGYA